MDMVTYALLAGKVRALDSKFDGVAEGFSYKGSVASVSALPASGNTAGDLYTVTAEGNARYLWNGSEWVNLNDETAELQNALNDLNRQLSDLETRLKSGDEEDADLHLGFYLDENGDLCQVDEEANNG